MTYNALYERPSALTTVAGDWTDVAQAVDQISVASNGTIFGQSPATNCVSNGQVSLIDTAYNAYDVHWTYSNCQGTEAILNGVQFQGIGTLDNTVSPEMFILGATGIVQGVIVSVTATYARI